MYLFQVNKDFSTPEQNC